MLCENPLGFMLVTVGCHSEDDELTVGIGFDLGLCITITGSLTDPSWRLFSSAFGGGGGFALETATGHRFSELAGIFFNNCKLLTPGSPAGGPIFTVFV